MKIDQIYNSNSGKEILFSKPEIWTELSKVFTNPNFQFKRGNSQLIRMTVSKSLNRFGWADSVKIEPTNLTINFVKRNVGLCVQLGNVARTYADLLKIQILFEKNIIDVGVIAVPGRFDSKKMGSNHAQYERLEEELKLFKNIITVPLVLICLST